MGIHSAGTGNNVSKYDDILKIDLVVKLLTMR